MNTQTKKTQVEIKVLAINTLYAYAEKYINHEKARLTPFIGLDIFKVDGSFKMKYDSPKLSNKIQLPDGTFVNAHYWFTHYSNEFGINIKICVNGGSYDVRPETAFCQYEEQYFTLFKKVDGKLVETEIDREYLKKRYNVAELTSVANSIKEAAKLYELAAGKMPHLFNDVFFLQRLSR
jgi:hypothetical protein